MTNEATNLGKYEITRGASDGRSSAFENNLRDAKARARAAVTSRRTPSSNVFCGNELLFEAWRESDGGKVKTRAAAAEKSAFDKLVDSSKRSAAVVR